MARVRYNLPIERTGYRPYGMTNPAAAAAGDLTPRTKLSGLGLLGAAVPDGSIVQYQGTWAGSLWAADISSVISEVEATLAKNGWQVTSVNNAANGLVNQNVTMTILINTGLGGYGAPQDIISIINNAVYQATGQMPLSGTIPSVQVPSAPGPSDTGMPANPLVAATAPTGASTLVSWFENNAIYIGLGIAAVVLLEHYA